MAEQELIERCQAGDRQAQQELYNQTSQRVHALLLKMTSSPEDAFDLTQETYVKAFARMGQFDGRSSMATWLYRVATNEALQFLRRDNRARKKLQQLAADQRIESPTEGTALRLDVNDALASVDAEERAILLLRYQEGLDYRTIARVLGCPAGTVASRLNRARQRVREILRGDYGLPGETAMGRRSRGRSH